MRKGLRVCLLIGLHIVLICLRDAKVFSVKIGKRAFRDQVIYSCSPDVRQMRQTGRRTDVQIAIGKVLFRQRLIVLAPGKTAVDVKLFAVSVQIQDLLPAIQLGCNEIRVLQIVLVADEIGKIIVA